LGNKWRFIKKEEAPIKETPSTHYETLYYYCRWAIYFYL